ncbi:unnamed protein product (macronuclear) [Paramecium tetraurelia]|uniref:Uncharacterized protein n=1 Tax=Paramecium tetraurelia TaxID=5888 RepID=A0E4Y4_PARTE|nr:uncharacterized protein GSPATT00023527001 [Paramecium tetraurelia]CAK90351.1 unnamed protein product [Paramecium tetraurelia]|eukprot:XP_001457748.1 hypothetical protein (macronuclear) [Paramecium tetraurelia strain d4-2]
MRENFHVKIRAEQRQKEFAKRRIIKLQATPQYFRQAVLENPISELLKDIDQPDYLQFISFLSSVEDYQCNKYMADQGVLVVTIEKTISLLKNYTQNSTQEASLNYLLSIIGNLIDFIQFPDDKIRLIIQRAIEISNYSLTEFKLTLIWLIDEYHKKEKLQEDFLFCVINFLFNHMGRKDLTSAVFDTIINLQCNQPVYLSKENLDELAKHIGDDDNQTVQKSLFILVNYLEIAKKIELDEDVIILLNELFKNKDYLALLRLCNILYPRIQLEPKLILQRMQMCAFGLKLQEYFALINKLIADNIVCPQEYLKSLQNIEMENQCENNKSMILQQISQYQD